MIKTIKKTINTKIKRTIYQTTITNNYIISILHKVI